MHSWELLHHKRPCFISFCRVLFACEGLASKYFFISSLRSLLIKFMRSCHGIYFFLQSMMISITYATFSFLNGITSSIFLSSPPISVTRPLQNVHRRIEGFKDLLRRWWWTIMDVAWFLNQNICPVWTIQGENLCIICFQHLPAWRRREMLDSFLGNGIVIVSRNCL